MRACTSSCSPCLPRCASPSRTAACSAWNEAAYAARLQTLKAETSDVSAHLSPRSRFTAAAPSRAGRKRLRHALVAAADAGVDVLDFRHAADGSPWSLSELAVA